MVQCGACGTRERTVRLKNEDDETFALICYCPHCEIQYDGEIDEDIEPVTGRIRRRRKE